MTTAEQLQQQIGPRGQATIDSTNRNAVRRWLRQQGLSERTAGRAKMAELRSAYNDTTDAKLAELLTADADSRTSQARNLFSAQQTTDEQEQVTMTATEEQPAKTNGHGKTNGHQSNGSGGPDVNRVAQMLAELMASGGSGPVDRDEVAGIVREIVPDLVKEHAPVTRVEIVRDGREPRKVEGTAHACLPKVLKAAAAGVNCWLAGPAGSGKTILAEQVAEALELPFYSTGAVSSDFRLVGFIDARGELVRTPFREAFESGGVFLLDEADASNPNALVALNQAIDNGSFAFPDGMVSKHKDFVCLVAANTYGNGATSQYVGRTKLDGATLDRFAFVTMDYDDAIERAAAGDWPEWADKVQAARKAARDLGLQHIISPRATRDGAKLLEQGIASNSITEMTLRKGLDADSWAKLKHAADL